MQSIAVGVVEAASIVLHANVARRVDPQDPFPRHLVYQLGVFPAAVHRTHHPTGRVVDDLHALLHQPVHGHTLADQRAIVVGQEELGIGRHVVDHLGTGGAVGLARLVRLLAIHKGCCRDIVRQLAAQQVPVAIKAQVEHADVDRLPCGPGSVPRLRTHERHPLALDPGDSAGAVVHRQLQTDDMLHLGQLLEQRLGSPLLRQLLDEGHRHADVDPLPVAAFYRNSHALQLVDHGRHVLLTVDDERDANLAPVVQQSPRAGQLLRRLDAPLLVRNDKILVDRTKGRIVEKIGQLRIGQG